MQVQIHSIVLHLEGTKQVQDYPPHMPIPKIGEQLMFGEFGRFEVVNIVHCISETITTIEIYTSKLHEYQ